MKKTAILFIISILIPNFIMAQEEAPDAPPPENAPIPSAPALEQELFIPKFGVQISLGPVFGTSIFREKNTIWFPAGQMGNYNLVSKLEYDLTSLYMVTGLDFKTRIFADIHPSASRGFIIGGKVLVGLSGEQRGKVNNEWVKEEMSEDNYLTIGNISFGVTDIIKINDNLNYISEVGYSFTMADSGDDDGNEHSYWGSGIFSNIFLQFKLSKTMYIELGINSVIDILSSQEGKIRNYLTNSKQFIEYEDAGRAFDQISMSFSLCIGWNIDLTF